MLRAGHVPFHPHRNRPRSRHRPPGRCRPALRRGAVARRTAAAAAASGRLRRPSLDRGLAAALDRERESDLGPAHAAFDPFDHTAVLRARSARLARAGLSAPKIRTLKAIAKAIDRGELDLPALVGDAGRRGARSADRGARHRSLDRRHLSSVLPRARATPGPPATSRCKRRRDCCSTSRRGRRRRRWGRSPRRGDRGAARPPTCCGRTIARPSSAKARRSRRRRQSGG